MNPIRELFAEGCWTELLAETRTEAEVLSSFLKDLNGLKNRQDRFSVNITVDLLS